MCWIVVVLLVTILAKVEIFTDRAFVADSHYRMGLASIAGHWIMDIMQIMDILTFIFLLTRLLSRLYTRHFCTQFLLRTNHFEVLAFIWNLIVVSGLALANLNLGFDFFDNRGHYLFKLFVNHVSYFLLFSGFFQDFALNFCMMFRLFVHNLLYLVDVINILFKKILH